MSHYNPYGYPPTHAGGYNDPAYRVEGGMYPEDRRLEHEVREMEAYGHMRPAVVVDPLLRPAIVDPLMRPGYPMDRHGEVRVDRHGDVIVEPGRPMVATDRYGDVIVETRRAEVVVEPHRREVIVEPRIDPYGHGRYNEPVVVGGNVAYDMERRREQMIAREVAEEIRHEVREEIREEAAYGRDYYGEERRHGDKHHSEYREYRPY